MTPAPAPSPARSARLTRRLGFGAVAALVITLFWMSAHDGLRELLGGDAAHSYYNLQVEGYQAGQLSLKKDVPPALTRLADPYDPLANRAFRIPPTLADDLSYYHGRFYLYFGPTPALLLFWPWAALTGHYLPERAAVAAFCTVGFLASMGLFLALWRRYFPAVADGTAAGGALALGLATGLPILLQRADVYEVSISCAYMCTLLALAGVVRALADPGRGAGWLAAASLALGLGVAARPPVLFCAPLLLLPMLAAAPFPAGHWRRLAVAAAAPLGLCGAGLMIYNARRFGSAFEFGQHYQLSGIRQDTVRHFSPSFLWFNFRVYFLEPMRWRPDFPFLANIIPPPLPPGHGIVEQPFSPFGVLTNLPFTLFALAAPLAWRQRRADPGLTGAIAGSAVLFLAPALVTLLFFGTCSRYEVEFLPGLVLLAAIGVLGLEVAPLAPGVRMAVRAGWLATLLFSIGFTLCASLERAVLEHGYAGHTLSDLGRQPEAIDQLQDALRIQPGDVDARIDLGVAWARAGRLPEAVTAFAAAVRADPQRIEARDDLGNGLVQLGRFDEGMAQYQAGLRLHPESAQTHYNLAVALLRTGRTAEAKLEYDRAVALNPDLARR